MIRPIVSRSEAMAKGLQRYYEGRPCKKAKHDSERYTKNGGCVECMKQARSPTRQIETELMRNPMKRSIENRAILSGVEQAKALDAFARAGRHEDAAAALKITVQQLQARRAANHTFDQAYSKLEQQFADGVLAPSCSEGFEWTPELRQRLIDAYVDTGVIADAREAIGVTPSVYLKELERNPEFAQAVAEAEPKAQRHLEEKAIQLALKGNDKLLTAVLKAKNPEYRDSLKVDLNQTVKLSDSQLRSRIANLQQLLGFGPAIDVEYSEAARRLPAAAGRAIEPAQAEQVSDAVP